MPEFEARTVKEAIEKGLSALNLTAEDADIQVLDEGRSGVFGMGTKPARVRIVPKTAAVEALESEDAAEPSPEEPPAQASVEEEAPFSQPDSPLVEADQRILALATEFLQGVLTHMGLNATLETEVIPGESPSYRVNITGEDLGILIGRRAETLDSLQYLTRLVVNQHTHRWHRIEVDVENYKRRRASRLERLAHTMADQAVREGRTMVLEPMPPRERRLVHLALRDREDVRTESVGEGDERKVTIIPL